MTIPANEAAAEQTLAGCQALLARGGAQKVLDLAEHALAGAPGLLSAHLWRGLALKDLARLEDSRFAFEQALRVDATCMPAHANRAAILRRLGRSAEALTACDAAIALDPQFSATRCNRGLALNDLDRPHEALEEFDLAVALAPDFAAAHGNRGKTLHALGRFEEALLAYRRVMTLEPSSAQVYLNASHTSLILGQLEQGFAWYEWRKRLTAAAAHPEFATPWLGAEPIAGKTLLLQAEQGYGDTIQFCRYARLLQQEGARVVLSVQPRLVRLLRSLGSDIQVCSQSDAPPKVDYVCALLSVPFAVRTGLTEIPAPPHLKAEPDRIARWRAFIGNRGFRIGINWQGNPTSPADRGRSLPLTALEGIAALTDVRLISLQYGPGNEQTHAWQQRFELQTMPPEFDHGSNAFLDTAAALESVDLVITSDTAVAHLAGSLGRPTWLALSCVADWRWLDKRVDSPWYPSMRLFRQSKRGDWAGVFERMRHELFALQQYAATRDLASESV